MTPKTLLAVSALFLALGGVVWLMAEPLGRPPLLGPTAFQATTTMTIGPASATPATLRVATPTQVTVTAKISDPSVVKTSVNLLRINTSGNPTILGQMKDDGANGDLSPNDHIYTLRIVVNELTPGTLLLQVSAAFRGLLRRATSPSMPLHIQGLLLSDLAKLNELIIVGTVSAATSRFDDQTSVIFTYYNVIPSMTIKGQTLASVTVKIPGGTVGNITQQVQQVSSMKLGQKVILLLSKSADGNTYLLRDGPLGAFSVREDHIYGSVAIADRGYKRLDLAVPLDPSYRELLIISEKGQLTVDALVSVLRP